MYEQLFNLVMESRNKRRLCHISISKLCQTRVPTISSWYWDTGPEDYTFAMKHNIVSAAPQLRTTLVSLHHQFHYKKNILIHMKNIIHLIWFFKTKFPSEKVVYVFLDGKKVITCLPSHLRLPPTIPWGRQGSGRGRGELGVSLHIEINVSLDATASRDRREGCQSNPQLTVVFDAVWSCFNLLQHSDTMRQERFTFTTSTKSRIRFYLKQKKSWFKINLYPVVVSGTMVSISSVPRETWGAPC